MHEEVREFDRRAERRHRSGWTIALASALLATSSLPADAAEKSPSIMVDAARVTGPLKPLRGVNGAPDLTFLGADSPASPAGAEGHPRANVSAAYRAARVTLVRTHDSDGVADIDPHVDSLPPVIPPGAGPAGAGRMAAWMDLNVMFPRRDADPQREDSYHFDPTDALVKSIRAIGADVLFRLGREGMTTAPPPADLRRYGEIIRHIVLHYDRGWAHGFHSSVKYWEVWNEPDLGHIWWRGTPEQYYALYEAAARAVKAADPNALVGGPTIALVNEPTPYREGFLGYVRDHRLPLDFFPWHWYSVGSDDPYDFSRIAVRLRALLDQYGFRRTQSFLDEWNYDFRELRTAPPLQVAAFVATAAAYMQDAPIDESALYRADGEFLPSGAPRTATGQVLIELGRFADTPQRVAVTGADTDGLAVQAARSADGRVIRVLVSNYQIPVNKMGPRPGGDVMHEHGLFDLRLLPRRTIGYPASRRYQLAVAGLSAGSYRITHRRLAAQGETTTRAVQQVEHEVHLALDLPAYVVDSFEIVRDGHRT